MSRYRKVDSRIWNDAKFAALGDRGKLVFLMLLTHPNMTALGAMRATTSGLAEELGWEAEAFREAFREGLGEGMIEHDEKACFIALPNFIRYNPPESPNVVKAWMGALDLLPECSLKTRVIARSKAFAEGLHKGFAEALPEAFGKAMPKPMPIQEQEQEQEQEQDKVKSVAHRKSVATKKANGFDLATALSDVDPMVVADWASVRKGKRAAITATAIQAMRGEAEKAGLSMQEVLTMCCERGWAGFKASWDWQDGRGQSGTGERKAVV